VSTGWVDGLVAEHGLTAAWTPIARTTTAWVALAMPSWATDHDHALAALDLGMCFFVLDDSRDLRCCHDLARICRGESPAPDRPLQGAFADLFRRLPGPLDHFRDTRLAFAQALVDRQTRRDFDSEGYLALRETTIYTEAWLALMEVLGGFVLDTRQRARVAPAFRAACRWQLLDNERVSLSRDARTGTPNVISLVARERRCSVGEAIAAIDARAATEFAAYEAAAGRTGDYAIDLYLDALACSVRAVMEGHRGIERYQDRVRTA
jgi:hypothetical protein